MNMLFLLFLSAQLASSQDMFKIWFKTQVFIYHDLNPLKELSNVEPDCFGNIIAANYVLTAASCFMDVNSILRYSETKDKKPSHKEENLILSKSISVMNIGSTIVAQVGMFFCMFHWTPSYEEEWVSHFSWI
jgi:hypothetical protein